MFSISRRLKLGILILTLAASAALVIWYPLIDAPPVPRRTLRIGFEPVPMMQIRTGSGLSGLTVDTVREAAKRAGVSLQWVETGTSSDEAFQRGLVDLWPGMVDLPDRRKRIHITRPWMNTSHALVLRSDMDIPGGTFGGRIALLKVPLETRLASKEFPNAQLVRYPELKDIVEAVCGGSAAVGFLEGRAALASLREKLVECGTAELRIYPLREMTLPLGIGSTFEAAGAADKIREQIGSMFRDGTLAATMAKYSYFGLDDTWATYDLMSAIERTRLMAWVMSAVAVGLTLALWQTFALRQRKRSENTLRESEERFRRVFEEGPLGLALVGMDYRFVKVNGALCRMVGYDESELVQMSFVDITHPDDVAEDMELARQLFNRKIPFYRMQKRYLKKNGDVIWINLTASNLLGSDGEPLHGLAMVEDITEMKRTQEEALLMQKLESVGTLAGGIAHDFNNLLGAVEAQAELALAELDAGSKCNEELQAIREVAMRGSEIVRQLMIYAGKENAVVGLVDLSKAVDQMLALLKISVTKRAAIEADLDHELPKTRASAAQIQQIAMNLVTNASDAIGNHDGVIRVKTRHVTLRAESAEVLSGALTEGNYVQLEVSDTGRGMSPQTQAKVFDPFFTTKSAGRGLGLAVVLGIVRGLGGGIYVKSELGAGTTFQVLLPCVEPTALADGHLMPAAGDVVVPYQVGTVLIVEDEGHLRQAIGKMLSKTGFEVIEAPDGFSAINRLRAGGGKIDLILLDMTIPGASSQEVVAEAAKAKSNIKVILTSAYSQEMIASTISSPQIRDFIRKPFRFEDLLKMVRSSLSS